MSPGGLVSLVITLLLIICLVGWVGYAYFYPHTWSGQILIKVATFSCFSLPIIKYLLFSSTGLLLGGGGRAGPGTQPPLFI